MNDEPIALEAYEILAEAYASVIDTKPHNAYYERPATLSLLPEVGGMRVLDAACGPGVYAEWLVSRGAEVVGADVSPKMVELARRRLGPTVNVYHADLTRPLTFLDGESFDIVLSPLTMNYIKDWQLVCSEWRGFETVTVNMPTFRRSLEATLNPIMEAGFRLEKILEPRPTDEFKKADPGDYEKLLAQPIFLCIRARK